jgi:arginyl-tRNA synthetase
VKTDNPGGYIAVLDELHAEMKKRGYDVSMQVFMGDTGATTGTIMTSFGSASAAEVGRMLDARSEPWVAEIISKVEGKREMTHGFSMVCQTYYAAAM